MARLKSHPPQLVVTCARGSSAHAATFGKHLIERHLGIPVVAMAPNIATVYRRPLRLSGQLFLAISQSGRSDDLVESAVMAKNAGALTAALVNATDSPLAAACDIVLPMAAGPECSVAATKTFIASLAALLRLVALWNDADGDLPAALDRLPDRLAAAAALKLKEIANLHAEAFSGAEFLHGPVALVSTRYPILMFVPNDAAADGLRRLAADLTGKGAALFLADPGNNGAPAAGRLPVLASDHPETDALCQIQSFYAMMVELADRLGIDPDRPRHLQKVTRTR